MPYKISGYTYQNSIALIVNGVHKSKIQFTFQLGVNYSALWRVESSDSCIDILLIK